MPAAPLPPPTATPFLHAGKVSILAGALPHLAAVTVAATLGAWVRAHRHPMIPARTGPGGVAATA